MSKSGSGRLVCSLAGGAGGLFGSWIACILAFKKEIWSYIVWGEIPWVCYRLAGHSLSGDFVIRSLIGLFFGCAFGTAEKRQPKTGFWLGAFFSFLVSFFLLPDIGMVR